MPPAATRLGSLSDILVGAPDGVAQQPPVDALTGFDVVAQFSHGLLDRQVVRSLTQNGLATLSAYLPWNALSLPASLLALVPPRLALLLAVEDARLEVRLLQPRLAALHWPIDITGGASEPVVSGARRARATARPRTTARSLRSRTAEVAWRVEINLLTARLDVGLLDQSASTGGGPAPSPKGPAGGGLHADIGDLAGLATVSDTPSSGDGRSWNRRTLGVGEVVTGADARQDVPAGRWRFAMALDFANSAAPATAETAGIVDFLASDGGKTLLGQALAPLKAASGIRLTPTLTPAGPIPAASAASLPSFALQDTLLADERGRPVLSLCAQLAGSTGGVLRLVRPLLAGQDFAYAASQDLLAAAYRARWRVDAHGLSFVGEAPVELPVGDDPEVTETGRAQLSISFADALDDVKIGAMPEGRGDALQLFGRQRLQLLNLWKHGGERITDLGDLAKPADEVLLVPLTLFARQGSEPGVLNPNFRDLLVKLLAILVFPMVRSFEIRPQSISGYCSSATRTMLVRWTLKSWLDDVRPPVGGTVMERT